MDGSWEAVPLPGVVGCYQPLCKGQSESFEVLLGAAAGCLAPFVEHKGIGDAAVQKEPEDLPAWYVYNVVFFSLETQ